MARPSIDRASSTANTSTVDSAADGGIGVVAGGVEVQQRAAAMHVMLKSAPNSEADLSESFVAEGMSKDDAQAAAGAAAAPPKADAGAEGGAIAGGFESAQGFKSKFEAAVAAALTAPPGADGNNAETAAVASAPYGGSAETAAVASTVYGGPVSGSSGAVAATVAGLAAIWASKALANPPQAAADSGGNSVDVQNGEATVSADKVGARMAKDEVEPWGVGANIELPTGADLAFDHNQGAIGSGDVAELAYASFQRMKKGGLSNEAADE